MRQTLALNKLIEPEFFFFFPYIPLRGTPLYERAKAEGLLLSSKKNLHYLSAANDRQFSLNMKECPELLSAEEYNEICQQMLAFQESNNRLSFADEDGTNMPARVEDKSFSLIDDQQKAAIESAQSNVEVKAPGASPVKMFEPQAAQPAASEQKSGGIMAGIKSLFGG